MEFILINLANMGHPSLIYCRYTLFNTITEIPDPKNVGVDTLFVVLACTVMQILKIFFRVMTALNKGFQHKGTPQTPQ